MRVGTHLLHADLKGKPPQPTVSKKLWPNCTYSLLHTFIKNTYNTISMNANSNKLLLFMDIGMNQVKYFGYQLPWVIVYSVSLNDKLVTFYLHLPRSVNSSVLSEYGWSKWASVAMVVMSSSVDQHNWKDSAFPSCCKNGEMKKTRTCLS